LESGAVADLLRAVAHVLERHGIRWYLFGAQAAVIWGRPRFSADVDITAEMNLQSVAGFVAAMEEDGFDLMVRDVDFVSRTRVLPFVHRATSIPLDVVVAGAGLEEQFLSRAVPVDIAGTRVLVMSPEDLIITKVLAGRAKDIEDVRGIVRERHESLDLARIRQILALLEEALSRSDLTPVFEAELERATRTL
jgi:predicted nucleotidyltransferase